VTSSSELKKQAEVLKEEKQKVQEDLSEWKKKFQNLEGNRKS
jgi:FtsZ-binding cell division protein ZapB